MSSASGCPARFIIPIIFHTNLRIECGILGVKGKAN
jgi:hypothetical protein